MIRYLNFVCYDQEMKAFGYTLSVMIILLAGVCASVAQRVKVESAYYGTRDRGKDVRRQVQRFADYGEPFRVSNDTLRTDPAPNRRKILLVVYFVDGRRISDSVQEGDVFYFRGGGYAEAGAGSYSRGVRILRAVYGIRGRYANVTRIVQNFVRTRRPCTVSNETFGIDPFPGVTKRLQIAYFRHGRRRNENYVEGEVIHW
jgi:hypothetical protein